MAWKEELDELLKNGCSDSDIEDFIDEHPKVSGKNIWDYVYEYNAPAECKGCTYIQYSGMMPCSNCSRRVKPKDYYEPRD